MSTGYIARRTRIIDGTEAHAMGAPSKVGQVSDSRVFATEQEAEREAKAWRDSGDWSAEVIAAGPTLRVLGVRGTVEDDDSGSEWVYSETDSDGHPVPYTDEWIECTPDDDDREEGQTVASIAARVLRENGATQDCGSWWCDPDGSRIIDYGTGEREETSVHPYGFTPEQLAAVEEALAR